MDDRFYGRHLVDINESRGVVTSEDIRNDQGQMILPSGTSLNKDSIDRVVKFKLLKPLDNCIDITDQMTDKSLYAAINDFYTNEPSGVSIYTAIDVYAPLTLCCKYAASFSIIMQKLTVLESQFPKLFEKALYCGWLAMCIYIKRGKSEQETKDAFIAGLMHDIGMLHLNPDFVESTRKLEPEEWRQLQAHPLISFQVVKNIPGLSNNVCRAIAEHHESIDGTGYPAAKVSTQICSLAQLLHLLDSTYAIYEKNFKPRNRTLSDLIPIIQMNQHYRDNKNADMLIVLFKNIDTTTECFTPPEFIAVLIDLVKQKNSYVIHFLATAKEINNVVGYKHAERKLMSLQNIFLHIHICLTRSGLIDSSYITYIERSQTNTEIQDHREIEDTSIMLREIIHHCSKLQMALKLYIEECANDTWKEQLSDIEAALSSIPRPVITEGADKHLFELEL